MRICRLPIQFNNKTIYYDIINKKDCPFYLGYDRVYQGQMCEIGTQYFDECFLDYPDEWRRNEKLICPFQAIVSDNYLLIHPFTFNDQHPQNSQYTKMMRELNQKQNDERLTAFQNIDMIPLYKEDEIVVPSWMDFELYRSKYIELIKDIYKKQE